MTAPRRTFLYRAHRAAASLQRAIETSQPHLIIPCDDRVVRRLHQLHAEASRSERPPDSGSIRALIERSLGTPASFPILRRRDSLAALAALEDVRAPRTDSIRTISELRRWVAEHGLPVMLKLDGTSGGEVLVPVRLHEARARVPWHCLPRGLSRLKRAPEPDVHLPFDYLNDGGRASRSAHGGRPATVRCRWCGDMRRHGGRDRSPSPTWASSVVRVGGRQMKAAARATSDLGLSDVRLRSYRRRVRLLI
jgi:hypothetical protein